MSKSSPESFALDNQVSDGSEDEIKSIMKQQNEMTTAPSSNSPPRIKLKLRLNPASASTPQTGNSDNEDAHRKKKKHKKKKSHKKHKKEKPVEDEHVDIDDIQVVSSRHQRRKSEHVNVEDDDDDLARDNAPSASVHVPVGGKRPFALIQAEERQENGADDDEEEEYDYDNDDVSVGEGYHPTESQPRHASYSEYNHPMDRIHNNRDHHDDDGDDDDDEDDDDNDDNDDDHDYGHHGIHQKRDTRQEKLRMYHPTDISDSRSPSIDDGRAARPRSTSVSKSDQKPKKRGRPAKNKQPVRAESKQQEVPRKDLKSVFTKLLETLEKKDVYGFFLHPVDTTVITDYPKIIKNPMDFSTMRKKLENDQYKHIDDFRQDFLLIVTNAKIYNAPDTIYYRNADRLEQFGLKAIERTEKSLVYDYTVNAESDTNESRSRADSWASRKYSSASYSGSGKKDANVKVEEEVDILGLDSNTMLLPRKSSRQDSEAPFREMDSRAATPTRQTKKKKKKVTDAGVVYAPDGSLSAVGGVPDLMTLIPPEKPFADPPELTTTNVQALPSAFYSNRSNYDDWSANKHINHPAHFCDYGAFTALGREPPGAFYTAQDACYIYPLYGDDRGEAYMRSLWDFVSDLDLDHVADEKSRYLTRGAWDVLKQVLKDKESRETVDTEFGTVDVPSLMKQIEENEPPSGTEPTT